MLVVPVLWFMAISDTLALDKPTPMAYICDMAKRFNTVVQTDQFEARTKGRMSAADVVTVINLVAADPHCGDLVQGTGGVRKLRFAVKGKGKSGGVRVVYYYHNDTMPVFLMTLFAKKEKDNLTKAESNMLAIVARALRDKFGE